MKRISHSHKLKETLLKVQNRKGFKRSGRGKGRPFQPLKCTIVLPLLLAQRHTTSPFSKAPEVPARPEGAKDGGRNNTPGTCQNCLSDQKSIWISSERKFWFKGKHCSKTTKRQCLTHTTDSLKHVVENRVSANCGSSHTVSQREERWGCSPHIQPRISQPFHRISTFQIRRDYSGHRYHSKRRLHVQHRSFQCIFDNSNTPKRKKMDEISLDRENMPISSVGLWSRPSPKMVHKAHEITTELLETLGFVINKEKSIPSPTQILDYYLGIITDSQEMSLSLPMKRILKIQQACKNLLQKKNESVREFSKVRGNK